ncbi:MAG: hypothetical protein EA374_00030 [Acholeplasmatales bacterium]|nr:MAG: hypothetical protein EA374_00030 [Acholeplasmatales bacterium]
MIKLFTAKLESHATKMPLIKWLAQGYYRSICRKEALAAGIDATSRVLFVGAGAYPFSALYFATQCQANVTAVDIDADKVRKAHETFGPVLRCLCADGACVAVSDYDVIIIAKQVEPKDAVLNHVFSRARPDTKILVRDGVVPEAINHRVTSACRHHFRLVRRTWLLTA